ncbi:MAG: DUF1295 domain-containing protein [Alteromonas sp.]
MFLRSLVFTAIALALAAGFGLAGSQVSIEWRGFSAYALCVIFAFTIQWAGFIPAYLLQTERFYDLTGSLTYLSITAFILYVIQTELDLRDIILAAMVAIWAARLGTFLFMRISKDGIDKRFVKIKPNPFRFFTTWTIQGVWVTVTASAAFVAMLSQATVPLGWLGYIGIALWIIGLSFEAVADQQKRKFKVTQAETGHKFIHTGLWAYSRHPNYFGEILLWFGVLLVALPVLSGWAYITIISPLFVTLLLTRVSGVNLLEEAADKRFGDDPQYAKYKANTPVLVPRLGKAGY